MMTSTKKTPWLAALILGLIIGLGAVLRLIGIRFGLPMAYHNDEWVLVLATRQFFSGDFNPHNFLYPSLLMYIMYAFERLYFLFAAGQDNLSTLYTLCRVNVLLFGLVSLWLVYRLGKRLHDMRTGLLAALLLCITPLHVMHSHFATTDVPLTLFVLLTLWATLRMAETRTAADYILAGIAFGLTVSIKIPGAVLFVAILAGHLYGVAKSHGIHYGAVLAGAWRNGRKMLLATGAALAAAVLVYLVFARFEQWAPALMQRIPVELWVKYYDEIVAKAHAMAPKLAAVSLIGILALAYTSRLWVPQFSRILLLLGVAVGTFFATTPYAILDFKAFAHDFLFQMVISQSSWSGMFATKAPGYITNFTYLQDNFTPLLLLAAAGGVVLQIRARRIQYWILIIFALTYYAYIGSWKLMFDRYMIPLLPVIAIWAAWGIVNLIDLVLHRLQPGAALAGPAAQRKHRRAVAAAALVLILFLLVPGALMLKQSYAYDAYLLKVNTKKIAYDWAVTHLPKEALVLREQYTPEVELAGYNVHLVNFTFNDSVNAAYVQRHRIDYIIVTDKLWNRPIQDNGVLGVRKAYAEIPDYADLIYDLKPTPANPGPEVKIYQVRNAPQP
ncbi:MAG TPA: glycosyltransferase family 39 protein [bacterium]|nr:glycosyltransferase family 39 protein [bacterium]HPR87843.1 glycosyltransferase family 39 protein [bacterium]